MSSKYLDENGRPLPWSEYSLVYKTFFVLACPFVFIIMGLTMAFMSACEFVGIKIKS